MIAIYARQSMDKKDSISIETQIEFCKKEFNSNTETYKVYSDKGFSGKNIDRPSFTELLNDIDNRLISKVIVYRLDRISRSITDFANIMDLFEDNNVSFVSSTEKFDTSTPMGRAMLYIVMVFAQLERETIAERIKDNYYSRGKNGVFLGGPPPLGFTNTTDTLNGKNVRILKPNKDIEIVKELFDAYANSNRSLGVIAKDFKKKYGDKYGVWNNIKLSRILHNPVYVKANADIYNHYMAKKCIMVNDIEEYVEQKACYVYGKRDRSKNKYRNLEEHVVVLTLHDGIIEPDIFLKCQYKLEHNRQIKNSGHGKHTWLTGLVKCGYCNHSMNVKCYHRNTAYLYCSGKPNNVCDAELRTIYLSDVEGYVNNEVIKLLNSEEYNEDYTENIVNIQDNSLKIELFKTEEQIEKLISSLANSNDILIEYINKKIVELDMRKKELQQEMQKSIATKNTTPLPAPEDWENGDIEVKRAIAYSLIDKVFVKNSEIEISWKH